MRSELRWMTPACCAVRFGGAAGPLASGDPMLARAVEELTGYFAGESAPFTVPLSVPGGSQFERAVWGAIAGHPVRRDAQLRQIAAAVGEPDGAQAVGVACNRNPLPIIVPCHRVIGADGKLVGFGGGLCAASGGCSSWRPGSASSGTFGLF